MMQIPRFGGWSTAISNKSDEQVGDILVVAGAELLLTGQNPAHLQSYKIPETQEWLVYAGNDQAADVLDSVCIEKGLCSPEGMSWGEAEDMAEAKRNYSGELLLDLAEQVGLNAHALKERLKKMGGWLWDW